MMLPKFLSPMQLDDEKRFAAAAAELMATMDLDIVLMIDLDLRGKDESKWGVLASVFVRVVLQHLYQGFPLKFPPEVIAVYIAAGENIETPLHECEDCGYGLPRCFQACPLCGGRVGLGAYAVKRGRRAAFN